MTGQSENTDGIESPVVQFRPAGVDCRFPLRYDAEELAIVDAGGFYVAEFGWSGFAAGETNRLANWIVNTLNEAAEAESEREIVELIENVASL